MRTPGQHWDPNSGFGEYLGKELPLERIRAMKDQLTHEISDFTVSFILKKQLIGSGTLVMVGDNYGILTAQHVDELLQGKPFGLNISPDRHQFVLPEFCVEHRVVGRPQDQGQPEVGPDLAIIKILDPQHLGTVKAFKSFYRLDGKDAAQYLSEGARRMPWWIAGAPASFAVSEGAIESPDHTLGVTHFHGEASFEGIAGRGDYDLLTMRISTVDAGFPEQYGGVSGGGIWFSTFLMDEPGAFDTMKYEAPFLMGVAFCQGPPGDERMIVGHGPDSIYRLALSHLNR